MFYWRGMAELSIMQGAHMVRPGIRRQLHPAWDLAFTWLRHEPPIHHVALPWQALLTLISTSLFWGWTRMAGVLALSWGGITRIGEVLGAYRKNLVLPWPYDLGSRQGLTNLIG